MTLHFQDRGSGPEVIVFAGSLGTNHHMWFPQVQALSTSYRTIAYDQLGHGRSPAPDGPYSIAQLGEAALDLFDHLELERVSFVGLSIGGMVGQWLAANAPERIGRLILLCTTAHFPSPDPWIERAERVRADGGTDEIAAGIVARWLTPEYAAAHPERVEPLLTMIREQKAEGYAACCEALATMDLREAIARITTPTLVVGGKQDLAIPPEHQQFLADNIINAQPLELLDPGAHVVSIERADDVNRLIRAHLEAAP
jgi:3-oxoadipate enol-lactonase